MSRWRSLVGVAVSLACLALAVRGAQWPEIWSQLAQADPLLVTLSALLVAALLGARSARWGVLLMTLRRGAGWRDLVAAVNIGYMANNLLPARVGDLVRAYLWGDWTGASKVATLSTVAVERVVDLFCALIVLLLLLPFVVLPGWALWSGTVAGGVAIALAALLIALARLQEQLPRLVGRMAEAFPPLSRLPLERLTRSVMDGLAVLRRPGEGRAVVAWSLAIWIGQLLYAYLVMRSLGVQASLAAAAAITVFTSLGIALPSAPGGVGVYHFVAVLTLGLFGMDRDRALGAAFLLHGVSYALVSGMGLFFAWRASLTWDRLQNPVRGWSNG